MTRFLGLDLAHPVINAAGTWDPLAARRAFGADAPFPFSLFVTPTLGLEPSAGDPPPRLWEAPAGLVSATGRPGPGVTAYLHSVLAEHAALGVPLVVSVGARTPPELAELVGRLDLPGIAALELDLAAPADPARLSAFVHAARGATTRPVVAKLPATAADPLASARAAAAAGADALTLVGGVRGAPACPAAALAGRRPELSGPAIRAVVLAHLHVIAGAVDLPLVAVGGVQEGGHAAAFLTAGATLVAVGTESFRDPAAGARIARELAAI